MLCCSHILKKAPSSSACRAPPVIVTGFHGSLSTSSLHNRATCLGRTRHHHHTWITGHPHRIAFKNPSSVTTNAGHALVGHPGGCSSLGTTAGAGARAQVVSPAGILPDFAGNSRFLANHLARFSTLSVVSSTSSSSSPSSPLSSSASQSSQQGSPKSQVPQEKESSSDPGSSSAHQAKFGTSATTSTEDKDEDAWAVNESYTGHNGGGQDTDMHSRQTVDNDNGADYRISQGRRQYGAESDSSPPATTTSSRSAHSSDQHKGTQESHFHDDDDHHTNLRPSLSSFKDAASIEKSWRRTSDQLLADGATASHNPSSSSSSSSSSTTASSPSSSSSSTAGTPVSRPGGQNQAGNLDLSSSTLVQQMLFGDRRASSAEDKDWEAQGNAKNQDDLAIDQDILVNADAKADSPSLEELLHISSNNAVGDSTTTTSTTGPSSTLTPSAAAAAAASGPKKEGRSSSTKKNGGSGAPAAGEADEDHIAKLDICVGIVRAVERHPDAESLYVEQVDVGGGTADDDKKSEGSPSATGAATRTIVSGLVKYIPKDYLEGRAVIVVRNMKPSKLRGVTSQGMLLCGMEKDGDGLVTKVELLEPAEGSQPGDKVFFEGFTDEDTLPVPVLTPKRKWFEKTQVHFSVQDGIAFYKGSPFKTVRGLIRCRSINKGEIS